ncbi:hypothetical protein TESS_TESS_01600 [Tessaracoccus sp. O5.2]|uniref:ABC transporter substrate-binding protein n=1 Tax=Tessaracoccus sp. O5.2 TaxID=3157622 RepID=UPI0035EF0674
MVDDGAGGGLPDVWQFSDSYLRQYAEPGYLLDLGTVADYVDMDTFEDGLKGTGQLDGVQYSLPTGYSTWANFVNEDLIAEHGLEMPEGGTTFAEFGEWMSGVTEKTGGAVYGGTDITQRIQTFELALRAEGKNLYTDDGELGFTRRSSRPSGSPEPRCVTAPASRRASWRRSRPSPASVRG